MCGITGEEQAPVLHRLADEGAKRDDALPEDLALGQRPAIAGVEACVQLLPDPGIGPVGDIVGGIALYIHALYIGGAGAEQSESVLLVGVDQPVPRQRRFRQDPGPAERIDLLVFPPQPGRNDLTTGSMKAVGTNDVVALDRLPGSGSVAAKVDSRAVGIGAADRSAGDAEDDLTALG